MGSGLCFCLCICTHWTLTLDGFFPCLLEKAWLPNLWICSLPIGQKRPHVNYCVRVGLSWCHTEHFVQKEKLSEEAQIHSAPHLGVKAMLLFPCLGRITHLHWSAALYWNNWTMKSVFNSWFWYCLESTQRRFYFIFFTSPSKERCMQFSLCISWVFCLTTFLLPR